MTDPCDADFPEWEEEPLTGFHEIEIPPSELRRLGGMKWTTYPHCLPADVADMDYRVAKPISDALHTVSRREAFVYPLPASKRSFVHAFQRRMRQRYGWEVAPEQACEATDLLQAITALAFALTSPGESVAMFTPAYPRFFTCVENARRQVAEVPLSNTSGLHSIDLELLAETLARPDVTMFLLCNPHNPTGRVFSREEQAKIASLAKEHGVLVVSDEVHSDILFDGHRHVPFEKSGPGAAEHTITLQSPTKSFNIASLRCAIIYFGTAELQERFFCRFPSRALGQVSEPGRAAGIAAWNDSEAWLETALGIIQHNRDTFFSEAGSWAPSVTASVPEGTYFIWMDCRNLSTGTLSPAEYFRERAGVSLSDGGNFSASTSRFVRLNLSTSRHCMNEIVRRVSTAVVNS